MQTIYARRAKSKSDLDRLGPDPLESPGTTPKIPNILLFNYQVNLLRVGATELPEHRKNIIKTIALHPGASVLFHDDAACRLAIVRVHSEELASMFDRESRGMYKSDLCRYAMLYEHGGYYFDNDLDLIQDVRKVIATAACPETAVKAPVGCTCSAHSGTIFGQAVSAPATCGNHVKGNPTWAQRQFCFVESSCTGSWHSADLAQQVVSCGCPAVTFASAIEKSMSWIKNQKDENLFQAFMAATPGHPVVKAALDRTHKHYLNLHIEGHMPFSNPDPENGHLGPEMAGAAAREWLGVEALQIGFMPHKGSAETAYFFQERGDKHVLASLNMDLSSHTGKGCCCQIAVGDNHTAIAWSRFVGAGIACLHPGP